MARFRFTLYVAGDTPRSRLAEERMRALCAEHLGSDCEIRVVDVAADPDAADAARILAVPTLVKEAPTPLRRVMGDMTDTAAVLRGLHLPETPTSEHSTGTP